MRIYCPPEAVSQNRIIISDRGQIHHLADVYRLRRGDILYVFDGQSREYQCVIEKEGQGRVELLIQKERLVPEDDFGVSLACALPKKAKMDFIIEKATELGVSRIIPLLTDRTVIKITALRGREKLKHWQAVAREASKQCGRIRLPEVENITTFKELLGRIKDFDLAIIPFLGSCTRPIKEVCGDVKDKSVIVLIGPEGDFSEKEVSLALGKGCLGVSLGELVLKVDTAAVAALSYLRLSR